MSRPTSSGPNQHSKITGKLLPKKEEKNMRNETKIYYRSERFKSAIPASTGTSLFPNPLVTSSTPFRDYEYERPVCLLLLSLYSYHCG